VTRLVRADPVLGRHLFRVSAGGPVRRWCRRADLDTALGMALTALSLGFRPDDLEVTVGHLDPHAQPEDTRVSRVAAGAPWPTGTAVAVAARVGAIRIGVPPGAALTAPVTFADGDGFLRHALLVPGSPLAATPTVWLDGGSFLATHVHGRIDGQALLELHLGTSLHGAPDGRAPEHTASGAPLSAWRTAIARILMTVERALADAGFEPVSG